MSEMDFNFFVGRIEDAALAAIGAVAGEYAGEIEAYGGELEGTELSQALQAMSPRFPLFLVSYGSGTDTPETAISPEPGSPWWIRHDGTLIVIVADNDARGEREQRRGPSGVYQMISDVHQALSYRQFAVEVEGEEQPVILNPGEFKPTTVDFIAHLSEQTAYAVIFNFYFKYLSPDRRATATEMNQIVFTIDPLNNPRGKGGLPGVTIN